MPLLIAIQRFLPASVSVLSPVYPFLFFQVAVLVPAASVAAPVWLLPAVSMTFHSANFFVKSSKKLVEINSQDVFRKFLIWLLLMSPKAKEVSVYR